MVDVSENKAFIEFPTLEQFLIMIKSIRGGNSVESPDLLYDFNFDLDRNAIRVSWDQGLDSSFSEEDLEDISDRYIKMISAVPAAFTAGYKIHYINLLSNKGFAGVIFKYETPQGRMQEHRYIGGNIPSMMIPDEFLHDLLYLPSRV